MRDAKRLNAAPSPSGGSFGRHSASACRLVADDVQTTTSQPWKFFWIAASLPLGCRLDPLVDHHCSLASPWRMQMPAGKLFITNLTPMSRWGARADRLTNAGDVAGISHGRWRCRDQSRVVAKRTIWENWPSVAACRSSCRAWWHPLASQLSSPESRTVSARDHGRICA